MSSHKHVFALHCPNLNIYLKQSQFDINEPELVFRIQHVLRLRNNDSLILFTQTKHIFINITAIEKKKIQAILISEKNNISLTPHITAVLPLLKKQETEEAISRLCEVGVNQIQLIITEKTQRSWGGSHEIARLERICIATAEQSKHFSFPSIKAPIFFKQFLDQKYDCNIIFCDPQGILFSTFTQQNPILTPSYMVLVGPEGDLSPAEKTALLQKQCTLLSLTPTVLRAQDAIVLSCGMLRAFYKS